MCIKKLKYKHISIFRKTYKHAFPKLNDDRMAKEFACKRIGLECGFTATAESETELMKKVAEHAKSAHHMDHIDNATMEKVKKAIRDIK